MPLNVLLVDILTNIENSDLHTMLERSRKMELSSEKRNQNKYCQFHRDHSHDTSQCYDLSDQIENLIRRGHLKKYVGKRDTCSSQGNRKYDRTDRDDKDRSPSLTKREAEGKRPAVIKTIFGGPREVIMAIKERSAVAMTFYAEDSEGVHLPHNDA